MPSLPCGNLMPTLMFAGSSLSTTNVQVLRSTSTRYACEKQLSTSKQSLALGSREALSEPVHGPG
jgi:hypothetical protein